MSDTQANQPVQGSVPSEAAIETTLALLAENTSDEEKFAGLLLITKIIPPGDFVSLRRLFRGLPFDFLRRLLTTTKYIPDSPSPELFRSVALGILSSLCEDQTLACTAELTSFAHIFAKLLHQLFAEEQNSPEVTDILRCLFAMVASESGCRLVLQQPRAFKAIISALETSLSQDNTLPIARQGLISLLSHIVVNGRAIFDRNSRNLLWKCLLNLSLAFRRFQDALKFDLLHTLLYSLQLLSEEVPPGPAVEWPENIRVGLKDILMSRVGPTQREPALALAALMLRQHGEAWALGTDATPDFKFPSLLVNLAGVEIKLYLEDESPGHEQKAEKILPVVYEIMEIAITALSAEGSSTRQWSCMPPETLIQIQSAFEASFSTILAVIHDWQLKYQLEPEENPVRPVLVATARLVAAWLAEETVALHRQTIAILPGLLALSRYPGPPADQVDWVALFAPALLFLTSDTAGREAFIQENGPAWVADWIYNKLQKGSENVYWEQTISAAGVLLNVVLLSPEVVNTSPSLQQSLARLANTLPTLTLQLEQGYIQSRALLVLGNIVTLLLFAARAHASLLSGPQIDALHDSTLRFLGYASQTRDSSNVADTEVWADVSELWFLALNALSSQTKNLQRMATAVKEAPWWRRTLDLYKSGRLTLSDEDQQSFDAALRTFRV